MTPNTRALGAFYGLALGDALGMPTQSLSREQVQQRFGAITGLEDADADQPIAPNMPAGSITDDTEQAILVGELLVEGQGKIEPTVLAQRLIDWEAVMRAKGSQDLLGPSTKRARSPTTPPWASPAQRQWRRWCLRASTVWTWVKP